jgi:tetratricopeptide (TPR) repeat protein
LIDEKLLGPDHPDLANDLNNLGALYFSEGRYTDAEPVLKRALAIKQDAFGPNDPRLLQILDNYAIALSALNRNTEAATIDARVKEIRAKPATP